MKQGSIVWIALLGLVMLLVSALPASAFFYGPGNGWQVFDTMFDAPSPGGSGYGGMTLDGLVGDNTPYEFTLSGFGILKVTDVFESGDYYRIFNYGALFGTTPSSTWQYGVVTGDPEDASTSSLSHGTWLLSAGNYSLQFQNVFFESGDAAQIVNPDDPNFELGLPQPGLMASAFFRVDPSGDPTEPIPEPGTFALLGLGLAAAGLVSRRKR